MKKKILFILLLLLTGCVSTKEQVKLLNEKQALRYVKTHFGAADYKGIDSKSDDRINYIFIDKEYNFEYEVSTYRDEVSIDGSLLGYREITKSDFGGKYYEYIISILASDVLELEKKYNVLIKYNDGWHNIYNYINSSAFLSGVAPKDCSPTQTAFYSIYSKDSNNLILKENKIKAGEELVSLIKKIDKRKYLDTCSIWIRDDIQNSNGVYPILQTISLK